MSVDLEERPTKALDESAIAPETITPDQQSDMEEWFNQPSPDPPEFGAINSNKRGPAQSVAPDYGEMFRQPNLAELESGDQGESTPGFDYGKDDVGQPQTSKLNKRFRGLSGVKRWGVVFIGGVPLTVAMVVVGVLILLLLSGFQVGQVARVLKDFNYIFAVRNSRNFARRGLLAGLDPTSKYKITDKKSLSRLGLIDEANPERSKLKFDGKPSLLDRRPQTLSIGAEDIDIPQGFGRNTAFRGTERREFMKKVDEAILKDPALGRMSSYTRNKAAKATLQSVNIKLTRWDKTKRFFQDVKDWKTTVKDFYEDTGKKLDRAKAKVGVSTNDAKKASEATEEALKDPDIISDATGSPSQTAISRGIVETLEASETAIAKVAKKASKVSVVEIVGWLCLFRDLKKIILDGSLQRTYALGRLAGQSFTAYDQLKSGDTSLSAVGLTAKSYGDFATNVAYQQAVFGNLNNGSVSALNNGYDTQSLVGRGYEPVPEDLNIWNPLSTSKQLIVALGSISITRIMMIASPFIIVEALNTIGIVNINDEYDKADDGICNALTTPEGIIGAAVTEAIIQVVIGILTVGGGTAAAQGGKQGAKQGLVLAAKEVGSSLIGKVTFKAFQRQVAEYGVTTALRGTIWTFTKEAAKFAALTAGSIEAAALLEKVASAGSGSDLGGVGPDFNYFNKASVGANFLGNSYSQKVNYGRPSTSEELAEVRQTQYEEILLANKSQSFVTRLGLSNPRSPSSLFLATVHPDRSYFSKGIEYALNLPSLVFNPGKSNSIYSLAMGAFEKPDSSTFAQSGEDGDGYHVWFYSKAEEQKLMDDPSFDPDANAEYVEPKLNDLETKYGKCYKEDEAKMNADDTKRALDSSKNLIDLINSDSDEGMVYCFKALQEEDALRYRVYKADQTQKQYLEDVANATDSEPASGQTPVASTTTFDSVDVPCAEGTNDLGEASGYKDGRGYKIRLCSIPGFSSSGTEDVDSGVNLVRVNSTISEDTLSMFNDMKSKGINPKAVSSFRSNEFQTKQYGDGSSGEVAKPGFSSHQMGYAIDFELPKCNPGGKDDVGRDRSGCKDLPQTSPPCQNNTNPSSIKDDVPMGNAGDAMWDYLTKNASGFKFSQLCFEAWHWQHADEPVNIPGSSGLPGGMGSCSSGEVVVENAGKPHNANLRVQSVPGTTMRVAEAFCKNFENMVVDASSDGIALDGAGFRTYDEQVSLRRSNCGVSDYSIYKASSKSCIPETARPGESNHEEGLAVDFNNSGNKNTAVFKWLSTNAGRYGIKNLPSEAWHWSMDGN